SASNGSNRTAIVAPPFLGSQPRPDRCRNAIDQEAPLAAFSTRGPRVLKQVGRPLRGVKTAPARRGLGVAESAGSKLLKASGVIPNSFSPGARPGDLVSTLLG